MISLNPTPNEICVSTLLHNFKLKNKERRQKTKYYHNMLYFAGIRPSDEELRTITYEDLTWEEYLINVNLELWKEDFKARFKRLDYYLLFAKFSKNNKSYNPNKYKLKKK